MACHLKLFFSRSLWLVSDVSGGQVEMFSFHEHLQVLSFLFYAETFKQVAHTIADVHLRDNVVNVVYKMFDDNGEGDVHL